MYLVHALDSKMTMPTREWVGLPTFLPYNLLFLRRHDLLCDRFRITVQYLITVFLWFML